MRTHALLAAAAVAALAAPLVQAEDLPAPRLIAPRAGAERKAALDRYGGNAATEAAVVAGLDWLARHRDRDGSWDADGFPDRCAQGGAACDGIGKGQHGEPMPCPFDDAISALAVLAFLGHGHLPDPEGDETAQWLDEALQNLESPRTSWGFALATEALAEAEALERKGRWRDAVSRNAERLIAGREPDGAWGYATGMRGGSDVPYTAFVVQALVAARDAGVELPADLAPGVDRFLGELEEEKGKLAYLEDGRRYGYTPTAANAHCAAAIRELLEVGTKKPRHRAHLALVSGDKPVWKIEFKTLDVPGRGKIPVQIGSLSLYNWYYGTVASFQAGSGTWSNWFGKAKSALLPHQRKDGCAKGSWDPIGTYEKQTGGRVFATALAVLILEQPYRHRKLGS